MVINNFYFSSDGRIFAHFRHRINSILGYLYSVANDGFLFLSRAVGKYNNNITYKYNAKESIIFIIIIILNVSYR